MEKKRWKGSRSARTSLTSRRSRHTSPRGRPSAKSRRGSGPQARRRARDCPKRGSEAEETPWALPDVAEILQRPLLGKAYHFEKIYYDFERSKEQSRPMCSPPRSGKSASSERFRLRRGCPVVPGEDWPVPPPHSRLGSDPLANLLRADPKLF